MFLVFSQWEIHQDDIFNVTGSAFVASQVGVQSFDQMWRFERYFHFISLRFFTSLLYV